MPVLYLFKDHMIYMKTHISKDVTREDLLDYLSGDNYKDQSSVWREHAAEFIETSMGISSSFI